MKLNWSGIILQTVLAAFFIFAGWFYATFTNSYDEIFDEVGVQQIQTNLAAVTAERDFLMAVMVPQPLSRTDLEAFKGRAFTSQNFKEIQPEGSCIKFGTIGVEFNKKGSVDNFCASVTPHEKPRSGTYTSK